MLTVSIVLIIVSLILTIYSVYVIKHTHKVNEKVDKQNQTLSEQNEVLSKLQEDLSKENKELQNNLYLKKDKLDYFDKQLITIQEQIKNTEKNQEELSQKAFENYFQILENKYKEVEEEYDRDVDALNVAYSTAQLKLLQELEACKKDLDQLKETRAAAQQAQLKEQEIKEKLSFYCVKIQQSDLEDIKILERIRPQLNNQRILSMLIWSTFYQKPMTALCNNVVGSSIKCGIYKITNQKNDMCYIGQSVNISDRFKQHAKCGLGIDTPAKNKLYQAMLQDGLHNFSFEILEECPKEQLNKKESYYIDLYQSYEYGYNNNTGIKGDKN